MTDDVLNFTSLFQAMPIPRMIVEIKSDGYWVINANDMAEKYFGVKCDKIKGHELSELLDTENARHFIQGFEVCIKRKKMVTIQALPTIVGNLKVHG